MIMLTEGANAVRCDGQMDKSFYIRCSVILKFLVCFFTKNYQYEISSNV
jgi:hypothetical protein